MSLEDQIQISEEVRKKLAKEEEEKESETFRGTDHYRRTVQNRRLRRARSGDWLNARVETDFWLALLDFHTALQGVAAREIGALAYAYPAIGRLDRGRWSSGGARLSFDRCSLRRRIWQPSDGSKPFSFPNDTSTPSRWNISNGRSGRLPRISRFGRAPDEMAVEQVTPLARAALPDDRVLKTPCETLEGNAPDMRGRDRHGVAGPAVRRRGGR